MSGDGGFYTEISTRDNDKKEKREKKEKRKHRRKQGHGDIEEGLNDDHCIPEYNDEYRGQTYREEQYYVLQNDERDAYARANIQRH